MSSSKQAILQTFTCLRQLLGRTFRCLDKLVDDTSQLREQLKQFLELRSRKLGFIDYFLDRQSKPLRQHVGVSQIIHREFVEFLQDIGDVVDPSLILYFINLTYEVVSINLMQCLECSLPCFLNHVSGFFRREAQ